MKVPVTVAAALCALALLAPQRAEAQVPVDAFQKVSDFLDGIAHLAEWAQWAESAATALDAHTAPPPPPAGMAKRDDVLAFLEKQLADAQAIDIPQPSAPSPHLGTTPSGSFDEIRAALAPAAAALVTAVAELETMNSFHDQLTTAQTQIKQEFSVLNQVKQVFLDVAQTVPVETIQQTLVFAVVDIDGDFTDALNKVRNAVDVKEKASRLSVSGRANDLIASATDLRNALLVEQKALQAEADRLAKSAAALQTRFDALETRRGAVAFEEQGIAYLQNRIAAQQQQIGQLQRTINSNNQRIAELQNDRQTYIENQRQFYNLCPAHATYYACIHYDKRQQWDQQSANSSYVQTIEQEVASYVAQNNDAVRQQAALGNSIDSMRNQVATRTAALNAEKAKLQSDTDQWNVDAQKDLLDRQQSRADLHFQENRSELAQANDALSRLTALGGLH